MKNTAFITGAASATVAVIQYTAIALRRPERENPLLRASGLRALRSRSSATPVVTRRRYHR